MTDEELDRARAEHALQICGAMDMVPPVLDRATLAARLAREGWMPPDPLQAEVEKIEFTHCKDLFVVRDVIRFAIERGIEIGRNQ